MGRAQKDQDNEDKNEGKRRWPHTHLNDNVAVLDGRCVEVRGEGLGQLLHVAQCRHHPAPRSHVLRALLQVALRFGRGKRLIRHLKRKTKERERRHATRSRAREKKVRVVTEMHDRLEVMQSFERNKRQQKERKDRFKSKRRPRHR